MLELRQRAKGMEERKSGGAQSSSPQKRKRSTSSSRKGKGASSSKPKNPKKHSTAKKLSATEKKRKARLRRIRTALILLIALFGASAFLVALRALAFPPQKAGEEAQDVALPAPAEAARESEGEPQIPKSKPREMAENVATPLPIEPPAHAAAQALEIPEGSGVLCFVFDDAGHNLFQLEPFLKLPFPCAIAVLPSLPHSAECAKRIREAGKEAILHQPMQAVNLSIDPGPGAVKPGMSAEEIRKVVNANLDEIWPVSGLNNHEGSLVTADSSSMEAVFDVIEQRSIFFLDSRTIAETSAPEIAAERGMRILERAVFLDNSQEREEIIAAVLQGARTASRTGHAVMIGHVWSEELAEILAELYPSLIAAGYRVADLSSLLASLEGGNAPRIGGL